MTRSERYVLARLADVSGQWMRQSNLPNGNGHCDHSGCHYASNATMAKLEERAFVERRSKFGWAYRITVAGLAALDEAQP